MSRQTIYIAIAVLVILIVLGIFIYYRGKKNASPPKVVYPQGGEGVPAGWSPTPLVTKLYNTMSGFNIDKLSRDQTWIELANLPTDDMVVAVYSVFNQLHFKEGEGTLTEWINDESTLGWPSGPKNLALKRLSQLNLV